MIIPPYPFTLEDPPNVPLEDAWYARPQLFFSCWFRPTGGRPPTQGNYTIGPDDFQMELVFFSTFEELQLPARGPMDHATTKLYEPSPTPILFVAPLNNVLDRVPLFPCSWTATPLPRYHTICAISKPALFRMGQLMQPSLKAGGEATLTR
jgi:hypothetical protein